MAAAYARRHFGRLNTSVIGVLVGKLPKITTQNSIGEFRGVDASEDAKLWRDLVLYFRKKKGLTFDETRDIRSAVKKKDFILGPWTEGGFSAEEGPSPWEYPGNQLCLKSEDICQEFRDGIDSVFFFEKTPPPTTTKNKQEANC